MPVTLLALIATTWSTLFNSIEYTPSFYYGLIVAIISIFRVIMYIFNPIMVAQVKIDKYLWEKDAKIREVTIAWTKTILNFMSYRSAMSVVVLFLPETIFRQIFCLINVCLDIHLLRGIWTKFVNGKANGNIAIIHQSSGNPLTLQLLITIPGLIYAIHLMMELNRVLKAE